MSDKLYEVAVILTIPAKTYKKAMTAALQIGHDLGIDEGVGVRVVVDYERDNDNQRVVYLDDEKKARKV